MSKKTKSFVYQLISFAVFFIGLTFLIKQFFPLNDFVTKLVAFILGTIFAPKFQAVKTKDGEKLFMKWIFVKGLREIN